jgi:hypothetical protein
MENQIFVGWTGQAAKTLAGKMRITHLILRLVIFHLDIFRVKFIEVRG